MFIGVALSISGASFGGVLAILLSLLSSGIVGLAFAFGMLSLVMVFALSRLAGRAGILALVLAGVILSSFYGTLVGVVQCLADPETKLPGMVIPHFACMIVGPDYRTLLPAFALMGGIYLLIMDCLARNLTMLEIPIGLLTSLVVSTFFALVFWKMQARGWGRD